MELTSAAAIARTVSGAVIAGDPTIAVGADVVIDSRLVTPGALFVALPGERVDGHDFVAMAAAGGASAALVARPTGANLTEIQVGDPVLALAVLARAQVDAARARGLRTVAITGSSGKTSTKDLLAQVLEAAAVTVAPRGSFNNEIGTPLTALTLTPQTKFLVAEMGARGPGHIRRLTEIVPPDIGVVCNVGSAHLGEFGSVKGIADAKGELVEAVPADGWAVLNADDPRVLAMASRAAAQVMLVSAIGQPQGPAAVWADDVVADGQERYGFALCATGQRPQPVQLQVTGRHMVANAVSAAGAAVALGLPLDGIAEALSAATSRSAWRMDVQRRSDGVTVVNDSYNANPDSMRAALDTVSRMVAAGRVGSPGARLYAVLGDMLELGESAASEHTAIGRRAAEVGVDVVLAVGGFAEQIVAGAASGGAEGHTLGAKEEAVLRLVDLRPGDVVLVKASRGVGLETVAGELLGAPC